MYFVFRSALKGAFERFIYDSCKTKKNLKVQIFYIFAEKNGC